MRIFWGYWLYRCVYDKQDTKVKDIVEISEYNKTINFLYTACWNLSVYNDLR